MPTECASTSISLMRRGSVLADVRSPRSSAERSSSTMRKWRCGRGAKACGGRCRRVMARPAGEFEAAAAATGPVGDLDIVYEDDALIVVNKPRRAVDSAARTAAGGSVGIRSDRAAIAIARSPPAVPGPPHRSGHVRPRGVCERRRGAADPEGSVQASRTGPHVLGDRIRHDPTPSSGVWRDVLVWDEKALIQKETHPKDPEGNEALSEYRGDRVVRRGVADGSDVCARGAVTRFGFRRDCAVTRSSAKSDIPTVPSHFGRSISAVRRSTRNG